DGMNLVAKEYCACRIDQDGTLILSQFAGAAEQLKPDALLVNPYDIEQMADTIVKAFRMSPAECTARMKRMRRMVRKENVFSWVDSFLAAGSQLSRTFPGRRRRLKNRTSGCLSQPDQRSSTSTCPPQTGCSGCSAGSSSSLRLNFSYCAETSGHGRNRSLPDSPGRSRAAGVLPL